MNSNDKNPVVLVHGIFCTANEMRHIEGYLRNGGWTVYAVSLKPNSGRIGIDELASQLDKFIKDHIQPNQKFDLVGFSMGGLVCRYYIQRLGGLPRIEHFITISTPHHGTWLAYLLNNAGAKQMRVNSEFICGLNKDIDTLSSLKFTSIWSPFDLMIIPASSSHLNFGNEIKIFGILHPLMVHIHKCIKAIKAELLK